MSTVKLASVGCTLRIPETGFFSQGLECSVSTAEPREWPTRLNARSPSTRMVLTIWSVS